MDIVGGDGCIRIDESVASQSWRASSALRLFEWRRRPMIRFTFLSHGLDMSDAGRLEVTATAEAVARGEGSRCGSAMGSRCRGSGVVESGGISNWADYAFGWREATTSLEPVASLAGLCIFFIFVLLKNIFSQIDPLKHISDIDLVKGGRPVDALIELRSAKCFSVLPSTSERVKIEERHSYWHPT
jgi:hypothetical protein